MGDEVEQALSVIEGLIGSKHEPSEQELQTIAKGAIAFVREMRHAFYAVQAVEERTRPNG